MKKPYMMMFPNLESFSGKVFMLPFNRDAFPKSILISKIKKYGFLVPILLVKTDVIDGVMRIYIVDGQHRALSCLSLNVPFYGILHDMKFKDKDELVEFVASLNSTQKTWNTNDYIKAFASVGLSEYHALIDVRKRCTFSYITLAQIYGNSNASLAANSLKNGNFKVQRKKEADKVLEYARELAHYKPSTNRMLLSLNRVMSISIFKKKKFTEAYAKYVHQLSKLHLDSFDDTFVSWLKS